MEGNSPVDQTGNDATVAVKTEGKELELDKLNQSKSDTNEDNSKASLSEQKSDQSVADVNVGNKSPLKENKSEMSERKGKIDVLLKAAGDAPIMKKKKWAVESNKTVAYLTQFIRKYIKCEPSESLFLYVNQTFVPSPDQVLSNLFDCFGTDGKLVLHYCKTQAWG